MKASTKIALTTIMMFLMIAGTASAASYSDADGDGVCEPGEEITFYGDISYFDENGKEHRYDTWYWDFDGDGNYEGRSRDITYIFDAEGTYTVTLYEINDDDNLVILTVEVKVDGPDPIPDDDAKFKKIKKILNWLEHKKIPIEVKIKLIIKHLEKIFGVELDNDDIEELTVYIYKLIDYYEDKKC